MYALQFKQEICTKGIGLESGAWAWVRAAGTGSLTCPTGRAGRSKGVTLEKCTSDSQENAEIWMPREERRCIKEQGVFSCPKSY